MAKDNYDFFFFRKIIKKKEGRNKDGRKTM